jgi:hypothetical protein
MPFRKGRSGGLLPPKAELDLVKKRLKDAREFDAAMEHEDGEHEA